MSSRLRLPASPDWTTRLRNSFGAFAEAWCEGESLGEVEGYGGPRLAPLESANEIGNLRTREASDAVMPQLPSIAAREPVSAALTTESLWKSYRMGAHEVHALRGIDLQIARGELVAIMGPSGCGKSTLLHTLGGLQTPTSGRLLVDGEDLTGLSDAGRTELRRKRMGFVFQRFNLLPTLTVDGNLRLAERICLGRADADRRRELLSMLGLSQKLGHKPTELSGGEQQRVALARALVHGPAILLADEPTGSLDSESSKNVLRMLQRVHRQLGQTIVLITHDIDVAEAAGRIIFMRDGALIER